MPYYSSTPAENVTQNTYAEYPAHVTSINLPKTVPQHFVYPPNTLVYSGLHGNIPENTCALSSLAVSDERVATCYGNSVPLKIILPRGVKANPNSPFELVVIASYTDNLGKMERSECRRKQEMFISKLSTTHYNLLPVRSQTHVSMKDR